MTSLHPPKHQVFSHTFSFLFSAGSCSQAVSSSIIQAPDLWDHVHSLRVARGLGKRTKETGEEALEDAEAQSIQNDMILLPAFEKAPSFMFIQLFMNYLPH